DRNTRADHQTAVQPIHCGAVGELELPVGKGALHDLDGVRGPPDRCDEVVGANAARSMLQPEADLRLDARVRQAGEPDDGAITFGTDQRAVVDRSPDRLVDAVARPDGAVGEADLAADRLPSLRQAVAVQRTRRLITLRRRETGVGIGERWCYARRLG